MSLPFVTRFLTVHDIPALPQLERRQWEAHQAASATQLRYYDRMGFQQSVSVLPDYFPHQASLNHGVLLRGQVPLSRWNPLWSLLPMQLLQALLKGMVWLSGVQAGRAKPPYMQGVTP